MAICKVATGDASNKSCLRTEITEKESEAGPKIYVIFLMPPTYFGQGKRGARFLIEQTLDAEKLRAIKLQKFECRLENNKLTLL